MDKRSKEFVMVVLYVLAMAAASNAFSSVRRQILAERDEGNGKSSEPMKVGTSPLPSPISTSIQNLILTSHSHTPSQPPISTSHFYSSSGETLPSTDNSSKLAPSDNSSVGASRQAENEFAQSSPHKVELNVSKMDDDKPVQSSLKGHEERGELNFQALPEDDVSRESKETSKSENHGDKIKNEGCESPDSLNITCLNGVLIACVLKSKIDSTKFLLVIQNTGDDDHNVNIESLGKIKIYFKSLNVPARSSEKVNFTAESLSELKINLNSGELADCVLQPKTLVSDRLPFDRLPAFAAQVTPIRGVYFLFTAAFIIVVGTWACCKFGRKGTAAGIPYRRLEMVGSVQSASPGSNETAAGDWDQSWDDEWDDEEAVKHKKQPEKANGIGISSTSAKVSKDGWEIDWDD